MICATVTSEGEKAKEDFAKAQEAADVVELRLDLMKLSEDELSKLLASKKKPVIVTNRKNDEGGGFQGQEQERIEALLKAAEMGVDYVDVELSSGAESIKLVKKKKGKAKLIVSYHNFNETPNNLRGIYGKIKETVCDVTKIAVMANDVNDNLKVFSLLQSQKASSKLIALCIGPYGTISRILYRKFGAFLTYASLPEGKESAPGQLTAYELRNVYRADRLNKETKIFGVISSPENRSNSPRMFNAAYKALNVNAVHVKFPVNDVGAFVKGFRNVVDGFAVTIPHKETIIPFLDKLDYAAEEIGAVNTVVKVKGKLKGYNTDVIGGIKALKEKAVIKGAKVIILGAGGMAKAMAYGIAKEGGRLTILNRTIEKAKALAEKYGSNHGSLERLGSTDYDVLINCTSVGMKGETLVDKTLLKGIVIDVVYTGSGETELVKDARAAGCLTVTGHEVLVLQALDQFRLWTEKEAIGTEAVMRRALKNATENA